MKWKFAACNEKMHKRIAKTSPIPVVSPLIIFLSTPFKSILNFICESYGEENKRYPIHVKQQMTANDIAGKNTQYKL